jgi:hypothetical protein
VPQRIQRRDRRHDHLEAFDRQHVGRQPGLRRPAGGDRGRRRRPATVGGRPQQVGHLLEAVRPGQRQAVAAAEVRPVGAQRGDAGLDGHL